MYSRILLFVLLSVSLIRAADNSGYSFGVNVMLGGRYDNLRMCVASPAGAKGGPIADIMLKTTYHINDRAAVALKLPIMRPILFGIAFKVLQFEPEITFEYQTEVSNDVSFVIGPALGVSFHYGPDFEASLDDEDPERFFAAGPILSALFGFGFTNDSGLSRIVGVRPFYTPLFAQGRSVGTVLGGTLEGHFDFAQ